MNITTSRIAIGVFIGITATLLMLLLASAVAMGTQLVFAQDITNKDRIMNRKNTGALLVDRNGTPFFAFYEARQNDIVPLSNISDYMKQALVAAEDKTFYTHNGFSSKSILAAFIANANAGSLRYGGSTITQQLVKITLLHSKKNLLRKYQEIILAREIERRYTKDEILEMYLNTAYFGQGAFGVEQAAEKYFGVPAKNLTAAQAAYLTALLRAPSELAADVDKSRERQQWVIEEMQQAGYLSHFTAMTALNEPLQFTTTPQASLSYEAPHFALMVKEWLLAKYGEEKVERGGFVVHTTLDLSWQHTAEDVVQQHVAEQQRQGVTNGATVVMDVKSGEVRALVGSIDWDNDQFGKVNMAITPRQPGSAFKPLVYLTAFEERDITPATILKDAPTTFGTTYKPQNYDGGFRGNVTARYALANSLNIPTVHVMNKIGVPALLSTAKKFGITSLSSPDTYGLSLALGAGEVPLIELTNAYTTFARKGAFQEPILVSRIEDKNGKEFYATKPNFREIVSDRYVYLITSILSDSKSRRAIFGESLTTKTAPVAVKTGTTQGYRDAWTVGYTPHLTVGVWIGNNDNSPMDRLSGSLGAAPIFKRLIDTFSAHYPHSEFVAPNGIVTRKVCAPYYPTAFSEYFASGTEPQKDCVMAPPSPSPETPTSATPEPTPAPTALPKPPEQRDKNDKEKRN